MSAHPLLFDLGRHRPTTREIADRVKAGGTAALTEAERRADEARYQEVVCRSALNRVEGMPFEWTLNPYRGCTHGCHYCFARRYHVQFEMNSDDEFASVILVKRELRRGAAPRARPAVVDARAGRVGTATDPYQPIEGHYRLTRRSIEALARGANADRPRDERADGRARPGRVGSAGDARRLHHLHERADRR